MALVRRFLSLFPAAVLAWFATAFASPPPFMSDTVFQASTGSGSTGRSLLQIDCPMDFEYQNYTIITSRCKGPHYPPTECCDSFKDFACQFAVYINNKSTNCADTMISSINFFGKYPEDLFTDECHIGKEGVSCEGVPRIDTGVSSGGQRARGSSASLIAILCRLGALLFH